VGCFDSWRRGPGRPRGCGTCCAGATISVARGPRRVIGSPSTCCATGGSTGRASTRGRSSTATGSPRQRLDDPLAHAALEQMLVLVDSIERQLQMLDARLSRRSRRSGKPSCGCITATAISAGQGKPSTVVNIAVARKPSAPVGRDDRSAPPPGGAAYAPSHPRTPTWGRGTDAKPGGPSNLSMRSRPAPIVRGSSRPRTLSCGADPRNLRVTVVVASASVARPHRPPP
jgi:hypothetical protein